MRSGFYAESRVRNAYRYGRDKHGQREIGAKNVEKGPKYGANGHLSPYETPGWPAGSRREGQVLVHGRHLASHGKAFWNNSKSPVGQNL